MFIDGPFSSDEDPLLSLLRPFLVGTESLPRSTVRFQTVRFVVDEERRLAATGPESPFVEGTSLNFVVCTYLIGQGTIS